MGEHAGCCETQRRGITPRLGGREGFLEEATFTMKWSEPGREVGGGESVPETPPGQRVGSESELQGYLRSQVLAKVREENRWVSQAVSAGHEGLHPVLFEARSRLGPWFPQLSSPSSSDYHGPGSTDPPYAVRSDPHHPGPPREGARAMGGLEPAPPRERPEASQPGRMAWGMGGGWEEEGREGSGLWIGPGLPGSNQVLRSADSWLECLRRN